jgi:hypothetical protein
MFDNGINTGDLFSTYVYVFPQVKLCFPRFFRPPHVSLFVRYTFRFITHRSVEMRRRASVSRNQEKKKKKQKKPGRISRSQHLRYNHAIRVTSNARHGL